ncbi:MAG: hypothetical protein IKU86_05125, partial [Thermoguttaceae bacterium]|nr:hypothetical protein [Thermoguttaceae bacterium]
IETLKDVGTWGRRAAIGCLVASLVASVFATVRLRPDVDADSSRLAADPQEQSDSREFAKLRRLAESLESPISRKAAVPTLAANDPLAAVDLDSLDLDPADRPFYARPLEERQAFAAEAVEKLRAARELGETAYFAALGDYLTRDSNLFWLFVGVDAFVRDAQTIDSTELDAALDRVEQRTADPNFRLLARLHRGLALASRPTQNPYSENFHKRRVLRERLEPSTRSCQTLNREFDAGRAYLAQAAKQGDARAATLLARFADIQQPLEITRVFADGVELRSSALHRHIFDGKVKYALDGAEAGEAEAQALAAVYLARGVAGERDLAEALRWGERFYEADVAAGDALSPSEPGVVPPSRRIFLERGGAGFKPIGVVGVGPLNCSKYWTTFLWLAEAALDSEPTPENLALAEKFLRRANRFESRSPFAYRAVPKGEGEIGNDFVLVRCDDLRVTSGFVEANERLAEAFADGSFGVQDTAKAEEFLRVAQEFADEIARDAANEPVLKPIAASLVRHRVPLSAAPADDALHSFVAPQTSEFEAVIAPIFAKLEKTLVDAKNGNADALTARFDEYFDDATDLYPNGRLDCPEVARYKVERLTREIERLEQTDADAETLERLRERRDVWTRFASA